MSASPSKTVSASPKSSPSKKEIDAATAALNHFAQGKRHLVVGDIQSAVNSLQEACRYLAEEYGETAPECGDAYFHYGKALLEMARIESGVLGNALDGVPVGEDMDNSQVESAEKATEEEWEMVSKDVGEALEENYKDIEKNVKTVNEKLGKKAMAESSKGAHALNGDGSEDEGIENPSRDVSDESSDAGGVGKLEVDECEEKSQLELSSTLGKDNVTSGGQMETETEESLQKSDKEDKQKIKLDKGKQKGPDGSSEEAKMVKAEKENDSKEAVNEKEGSTEDDEEEDEDGDSQEGESQDGDSQDEGSSKEETKEDNDESKSNDEEGEKTEEDEEEVSNLQLAWEMLELSKIIFQKQEKDNPEMTKKVAQVFLTLGEVGLESENYAQGIEDFKQCLEIQEKNLEKDDRCLAETHYHLGVAFSFSDDFDKAVEHFQAAVNVIELRISNLNKRMKEKETWTEEQKKKDAEVRPDPFYTEQGEIDELEKLLPEIREKIVDMEEMKKDTKEKMQKAAKAAFMAQTIGGRAPAWEESGSQGGFDAPSSSSSKSEAKSITHLVRKKRKSEDEATAEVKKAKVENGETTNSKTKSTNGQSENVDMEEKESSKGQSVEELKKKAAEDMKKTTKDITKEHSKATT
ncbi:histone-binding protein N1/N2 isoform X2 [Procambarus clarkii]|uniref:histone-binding protein N1/N2 isoform X2 n=1 Tax=Procambarus clarkii TaxID=6728 RepID=UPI001E67075D|nr:histone-binding protein N1/N2-like isoform X2 [Procambarus clarkii]